MGLFSNKNKLCPICGAATPRLLSTKIQGEPLCSDCAGQILADDVQVKNWSLEDVKKHLQYREENKKLVDSFLATRSLDCGKDIVIDDNRQMLYVKGWSEENPPIIQFDEIVGYELEIGWNTVEVWTRGMQRVPYQPPELGVLGSIAGLASAFSKDDDDNDSKSETLKLTLKLQNPYLTEYVLIDTSVFGNNLLAFQQELAQEMAQVNAVCGLLVSLTSGSVVSGNVNTTKAPPMADRTAEDIVKFKELMDAGIITQEEFNAKKKQLLGI